jgi:threonine/homoserine/homoserine lactone efflux protein
MSVLPSLLAFGLAATLLTITPGLDTAMVLRSAVAGGPRQAIATAIGIGLGCLAWGAAVALGLGIVLTASTLAYTVLKWAGALARGKPAFPPKRRDRGRDGRPDSSRQP